MPVILPAVVPSGELIFVWVDPNGVEREMSQTDAVLVLAEGAKGLGYIEPRIIDEKQPNNPGTFVRRGATGARDIELPLRFQAASPAALQALLDNVYSWFATADETTLSPGYLRVTRADDTVRQIACYYAGGLEGNLVWSAYGETWQRMTVQLRAPDPWPTAVEDETASFTQADLGDELSVINVGDFDAYPVWTIDGPINDLTVTNITTGKAFALTADGGLDLPSGDTLTVDTRPANLRTDLQIIDQDGGNYFRYIGSGGSLWWMPPGQNRFTVTGSGSTGDTAFSLSWLPRYRGVLR